MRIGRFRQAFADGRQLLMITPVNTVATSARVRHWSNSPHRGWQWSGPAGRPPPPPSPNPRRFDPLRMMRVEGEVARGKAQQARVAVCPSALGRTPGPFSCPGCRVAGWRIPLSGIWGSPTSLWANLPTTAPPPQPHVFGIAGAPTTTGPSPSPSPCGPTLAAAITEMFDKWVQKALVDVLTLVRDTKGRRRAVEVWPSGRRSAGGGASRIVSWEATGFTVWDVKRRNATIVFFL